MLVTMLTYTHAELFFNTNIKRNIYKIFKINMHMHLCIYIYIAIIINYAYLLIYNYVYHIFTLMKNALYLRSR